jgi:hypothetical protein
VAGLYFLGINELLLLFGGGLVVLVVSGFFRLRSRAAGAPSQSPLSADAFRLGATDTNGNPQWAQRWLACGAQNRDRGRSDHR